MIVACSQIGLGFGSTTDAALKIALIPCRNYRLSSLDKETKVTAKKYITNQYIGIITWLKPSKRETVHGLSQHGHFRQFINMKKENLHKLLS